MSLIKRVQIANHLDSSQIPKQWNPDFRLTTFNFHGQNAAVVIQNGGGKTTIANSILLLLTRHRTLAQQVKRAMAPSALSSYSHIRIEIVHPHEELTGDMFTQQGMEVQGEHWVYGVCGNTDGDGLTYYYYQGRLENCPVGRSEPGNIITLLTNSEFATCRNNVKTLRWGVTEDEYMRSLQPHFAVHATKRMLDFHLAGAGDKSAELYPTSKKKGTREDHALFFNAFAPELISGITGKEGEEDEDSFEKTILISATKYVGAMLQSEGRKKEFEALEKSLKQAAPLREAGTKMLAKKEAWELAKTDANFELIVLRKLIEDDIVPGIPRHEWIEPEDPWELWQGVVSSPDNGGDELLIMDRALAAFLDISCSRINETAASNAIEAIPLRKDVVGFPQRLGKSTAGGHASKGYSLEDALTLAVKVKGFEQQADLEAQLSEAFALWSEDYDTNPYRRETSQKRKEQNERILRREGLEHKSKALEQELKTLEELLSQSKKGQVAWEAMRDSGLFSVADLAEPVAAKDRIEEAYKKAQRFLAEHREQKAKLMELLPFWERFCQNFSEDSNPQTILEELRAKHRIQEGNVATHKAVHVEAGTAYDQAETLKADADKGVAATQKTLDSFNDLKDQVALFEDLFGEESASGLKDQVQRDLQALAETSSRIKESLAGIQEKLKALSAFRRDYPGQDIARVKEDVQEQYASRVVERGALTEELQDLQRQLLELKSNKTTPKRTALKAFNLLDRLHPVSLLAYLEQIDDLTHERRLEALTLFSNHLYAPVFESVDQAAEAVAILDESDIPSPVLVGPALREFVLSGQATSINEGQIVYSYHAGIRSLTVEALFDPAKIQQLIAQLQEKIAVGEKREQTLKGETDQLEQEVARLSMVMDAWDSGAEDRNRELLQEQTALIAQEPIVRGRASQDALNAIDAKLDFLKLGGQAAQEAALANMEVLFAGQQIALNTLEEAKERLRVATSTLRDAQGSFEAFNRQDFSYESRQMLETAIKFYGQQGPAFMVSAKETEQALLAPVETLDKQRRYQFDEAAVFAQSDDATRHELSSRRVRLSEDLERNRGQRERLATETEALNSEIIALKKFSKIVDEVAAEFIRNYIEKTPALGQDLMAQNLIPLKKMQELGKTTVLMEASFAYVKAVNQKSSLTSIANYAGQIIDAAFGILSQTTGKTEKAQREFASCEKVCELELSRFIDAEPAGLTTHEIDMIRLKGKDNIQQVLPIFAALDAKYEKDRDYVDKLIESENNARKDASERLATMAAGARDNLRRLRKVFAETPQSTFEVKAEIISEEGIAEVMQGVLDHVEKKERQKLQDKDDSSFYSDDESSSKNRRQTTLNEIRDHVYRRIFTNVDVKVVHPQMRAGRPFRYGETLSQGQRTAVGLMLMSKMAQYSMERDAVAMMGSLSASRRRKAMARSQSIMVFDGLFSNLSNRAIIKEAMQALKATKGNFQLIGLIHNEHYENDPDVFPSFTAVKKLQAPGGQGGFLVLDDELKPVAPGKIGRRAGEIETAQFLFEVGAQEGEHE
jgi:hypothetical protein